MEERLDGNKAATKHVLIWGFCGDVFNIAEKIDAQPNLTTFTVSDSAKTDLNIHDLFYRHFEKAPLNVKFRQKLLPHFDTFKELYSRHWYPKVISDEQYLHYFNLYIDYLAKLFTEHSFSTIIFSNVPHEGPDIIAYHMAKVLNIKTLIFYQTLFTNRTFVSETISLFDDNLIKSHHRGDSSQTERVAESVDKAINEIGNWFYMCKKPKPKHFSFLQVLQNSRRHLKKNPLLIMKLILNDLRFFKEYQKNVVESLSINNLKYVYFPLHLQPELTTSILGNGFTDQIKAIKHLSNLLPADYKIIVKENPKQNSFKRPPGYIDTLTSIDKVIFAPVNFPSIDLIKNAQAVTTINGTVGWEALNLGIPVIYYGICWYKDLPLVHSYNDLTDIEQISRNATAPQNLKEQATEFLLNNSIEGSVDDDYCRLDANFDYELNGERLSLFICHYIENSNSSCNNIINFSTRSSSI